LFYNLAMPRLAWFTPLPPDRSGIAAYSGELVPLVAATHAIDIFIDPAAPKPTVDPGVPVWPSSDFIWRHGVRPYDLVVYQLGNAPCHDYMWAYLGRFPGLVVLHDAQLHQSRAKKLLSSGRADEYRAEFAFCHPDANPGIAELVIAALGGLLYFLWPLNRVPIECARLVAVHTAGLAAQLRESFPAQEFRVVSMGVADPLNSAVRLTCSAPAGSPARHPRWGANMGVANPMASVASGEWRVASDDVGSGFSRIAHAARARHAIPAERVVFAAYGMLTPEKRLTEIFKALRALLPWAPDTHLLLVGQPADHYDVEADAREHGVADHVTVTGYVEDEELPAYLAAADVCLCLRWPTSRETSASWLRCLAAGKPTVITDLIHTAGVPALDPRTWTPLVPTGVVRSPRSKVRGPRSGVRGPGFGVACRVRTTSDFGLRTPDDAPICVAIDIVDEQHSLGLAMRRLARDRDLRRDLGCRAREYWARHHTLERMAEDYRQAIEAALARPAPDRSHLPAHLLQDGTALTRRILGEFGLSIESLD